MQGIMAILIAQFWTRSIQHLNLDEYGANMQNIALIKTHNMQNSRTRLWIKIIDCSKGKYDYCETLSEQTLLAPCSTLPQVSFKIQS